MTAPSSPHMQMPLVSIMIPTFNQAQFIVQAIESALAQTYPRLEVIVGDDASTDDTQSVVQAFMVRSPDARLSYLCHAANLGRVANYRKLLYEHAQGDYVLNLDGDDYLTEPSFIAQAMELAQGARPGQALPVMVVARATTLTPKGPVVSSIPARPACTGLQILAHLPSAPYMLMHMAVLYHRPSALAADFYRSSAISSDWESLYRLALRGPVAYLDQNIGVWRQHASNQTATQDAPALLDNLRIWQPIYAQARACGMSAWRANFRSAVCVAHFASASAISISRAGYLPMLQFIKRVAQEFRFATLLMVITPRYAARLVFGALGFYGRTALRHR